MSLDAPSLDDVRLRVVPGDGIVLRSPGVVAVAFPDGEQHHALVTSFLDALRSAGGGSDAGRRAARAVAGLLAAAEDAPPLGLVGSDGDGLAILLHGDVEFSHDAPSGDEVLSGRDAAAWLDRLLDQVPAHWSLARVGAGAADEWSDLREGTARGDGVATGVTTPTPATEPDTGADEPTPTPAVDEAPPPEVEPEPPTGPQVEVLPPPPPSTEPAKATSVSAPVPASDFVSVSLLDDEEDQDEEEALAPLPVAGADLPPPPPSPDEPAVAQVQGVNCARGHFNDPNSPFCATCGISMVQQTHNLVLGPRPPLGVFVLDDGSTYVVDRDLVIGREPEVDDGVIAGTSRGVGLPDPDRAISRVHARVTLEDWEVRLSDAGSANGTFVAARDATQWTPVAPDRPVTLTPGMHVLVGPRVLSFDTHRRG